MSQSRFSIVLVGVSALLRRPLVSRLRPADGERSSWVVFTARGCRFDSGFRWAVGLRVHRFRFSARTVSEWPLGEFVLPPSASEIALGGLAFGLTASAFRYAPLRGCRSAGWPSGSLLPLFGMRRIGDCRWASWSFRLLLRKLPSAGWFFRSAGWPSSSLLPLFGTHRFGDSAGRVRSSAFRFGNCPRRVGLRVHRFCFSACAASEMVAGRVGLRTHCFRFSACTDSEIALGGLVLSPSVSELPSASRPSGSLLPFFGTHRFGVALGGLAFGFTASAFRHAPLRSGRWAG